MKKLIQKNVSMYNEPDMWRLINFLKDHIPVKIESCRTQDFKNGTRSNFTISIDGDEKDIKTASEMIENNYYPYD